MKRFAWSYAGFWLAFLTGTAPITASAGESATGRSVFLNGDDVSSARNQKLTNVAITIDEDGNILIDAPQYRVHQENTYTPLSRNSRFGPGAPSHKSPKSLGLSTFPDAPPETPAKPLSDDIGSTKSAPALADNTTTDTAPLEKAGEKLPPAGMAEMNALQESGRGEAEPVLGDAQDTPKSGAATTTSATGKPK